ncbi:uncharacterized protein [Setaria viridis]|nr:uncharacterized protein LOC117840215 isoform X2 [Setaria viridis]
MVLDHAVTVSLFPFGHVDIQGANSQRHNRDGDQNVIGMANGPTTTQILPIGPTATQILPGAIRELFFSDSEMEKREKMLSFVASEVPVMEIAVPGYIRKRIKSSDPARHTTTAIVIWLCDLHKHGWTLNGKFDASDFGITHLGILKGEKHLMNKLKRLGGRMRWKDMEAGADMIKHAVYSDGLLVGLPADTEDLILLMRNFKRKNYFLIRFHICHDNEVKKSYLFVLMYNRLMVIQVIDKVKYGRIINKIRCGSKNWISRANENLNHRQDHFAKDDSIDIGSWQADLPVATAESAQLAAVFGADQVEHMYSIIAPKMLCRFQKAMHKEGELSKMTWYEDCWVVRLLRE